MLKQLLSFMCVVTLLCISHTRIRTLGRRLNDYELTSIGILDANHRRAILNKLTSKGTAEDDFSNVLGDLSSAIKDLECFSVVSL